MNNTLNISKKFTGLGKRLYSKGQGMTEYLVILGLIAIASIAVFALFGQTLKSQVAAMANEIGGTSGKTSQDAAKLSGAAAATNATTKTDMSNYTAGGKSASGGAAAPGN
jgi:Flp pilus assembly pilin Flp